MRELVLACFAALAFATAKDARGMQSLNATIDACEPRIDVQVDVGYSRIAARCPEIIRRLESSEWQAWLPRDWREPGNDLSLGGLRELATLIEREAVRERAGPRPGTATLHEVLERLEAVRPRREDFWGRFRNWLGTVLERPADRDSSAWLERLLSRGTASQVMIETMTYGALATIVVLAVSIIVNELAAARALRRRRARGGPSERLQFPREERLTPERVEHASLQERPALLLRLVLERLAQAGRLPRPANLTVREAQQLAELADPADRAQLAELAAVAEQVRYAGRPAASGLLSRAVEAGAQLLARLDMASRTS